MSGFSWDSVLRILSMFTKHLLALRQGARFFRNRMARATDATARTSHDFHQIVAGVFALEYFLNDGSALARPEMTATRTFLPPASMVASSAFRSREPDSNSR